MPELLLRSSGFYENDRFHAKNTCILSICMLIYGAMVFYHLRGGEPSCRISSPQKSA